MRKVVLYQLLSLDGVAEEPSDWLFDDASELVANLSAVIASQDDVLLGRGTFDYWAGFWPTSDFEPFASFINGTRKHVFTSSMPREEWANTSFVTSPAADYVGDLKQKSGGDIGIHGSTRLAQSLLRARLVDEIKLGVAPTIAGGGRRLFDDDDTLQRLELVDVQRSSKGTLFLTYRPFISN